jgi:predicted nucleic acid-binding protein
MTYVLDACALIALLNEEEGQDIVDDLFFKAAVVNNITLTMNIINLIEVIYNYYRDDGADTASKILGKIDSTPLEIVYIISQTVFHESYRLKGTYRISLADAIGLATAAEFSGVFVTSDHAELKPVEQNEKISFLWLPPKPKKK